MTMRRDQFVFLGTGLLLMLAALASLTFGTRIIAPGALWQFATAGGDGVDAVVLGASRVPRLLTALAVGCGLGLAGALLQTVTRNVLADPGLLGVNAGAALAVVLLIAFSRDAPPLAMLAFVATQGAIAAGLAVFLLAGGAGAFGARPLRLILSGGVMAIALGSLTQIVLLSSPGAFEASQIWLAGSVVDRPNGMLSVYLPPLAFLVAIGLLAAPGLSVLLVGESQGRALGADVAKRQVGALLVAAGLCGIGVSLAGPIAFVGLIAPHVARWLVGPRPTRMFAMSACWGAIVLTLADVLARFIVAPAELPLGLLIAVLGVPFYVVMLRRRSVAGP